MDGNCLFNSVSMSISSDEDLADVLRMMTRIDLYLQVSIQVIIYLMKYLKLGYLYVWIVYLLLVCISNFVFDLILNNVVV